MPEQSYPFINELKQFYMTVMIQQGCHPKFHHEYALLWLHGEGYQIAVCSNPVCGMIETMMEQSMLSLYIDLISNEDVTRARSAQKVMDNFKPLSDKKTVSLPSAKRIAWNSIWMTWRSYCPTGTG